MRKNGTARRGNATRARGRHHLWTCAPSNQKIHDMSILCQYFCNMYRHHPGTSSPVVPAPVSLALASSRLDSASIAVWKINKRRETRLRLRGKLPSTATTGSQNDAAAETVPLDLCRPPARKSSLCTQEAKGLVETLRIASNTSSGHSRREKGPTI